VRIVGRDLNPAHRDEPDSRVSQLARNEYGQITLNLVGNPDSALGFVSCSHGTGVSAGSGCDCLSQCSRRPLKSTRDLRDLKNLKLITFFNVVVSLEAQSAFEPGLHLLDIVLEALQG